MAVQTEATSNNLQLGDIMPTLFRTQSDAKINEAITVSLDDDDHHRTLLKTAATPTCSTVIDLLKLQGHRLDQAVFDLVTELFPEWIEGVSSLTVERVSGALTNAVFFVSANPNKRMLLRVYGLGCENIINRDNELKWLARLSNLGLGPRLLGIFGNGRFEEYLPSATLTRHDIRDPVISGLIAQRLCQLHSIVVDYPHQSSDGLAIWKSVDSWFSTVQLLFPDLLNKAHKYNTLKSLDLDRLGQEIKAAKSILSKVKSPIVFCHNDTQYGNILKLKGSHDLVVVDFEYADYNPRGYDIANHFCEWTYNYHGDTPAAMEEEMYPTIKQQERFLQAYLNTANDGTTMAQLFHEVEMWTMAAHLHWGLWGLLQAAQSEIDFDYVLYSLERIGAFRRDLARWV